jgi:alkylation response protein AidB-like acyl-CoA dehydrogenase
MSHYKSNLRDIEFNLFEVLGRQDVLGAGPYAEMDVDTARSILAEVERLAVDDLAASLLDSDRNPPVFDPSTQSVTLPESFKRSYKAYTDSEWWRLDLPEALGGQSCPPSLRWAVQEMVLGSNPAVHMYASGFAFAHVMWGLGTDEQKRLAQHIVDGRWGATMGARPSPTPGRRRGPAGPRRPQARRHVALEGVKRFITSAEHDLSDNIIHLVLAARGATARAPRDSRSSSSRSSWSTSRPARSASATVSTSPTSRRRWA